ncbi:alpha/beta hydrolase [Streptomyces sp. DH12]|uniref:alpha/beta hydrolase n=1 Tax=Streptomyces sp. DH12 TaxID=2857010 RepID=UPI001E29B5E8|nr:alpha/beta fold hydrolase [Streptomyces sp. DH12]
MADGAPTGDGGEGRLVVRRAPRDAAAAVLFLHGGRADALDAPRPLDPPALRLRPFASAVLRATRGDAVAVAGVRYRHRGWNGSREDALHDARRALAELHRHAGPVPVVLVGHSMGGRAALRLAGDRHVRGVVALAPWCPPGEPVAHLRGRHVVVLHDERDRVTAARGSWELVRRSREAGAHAVGVSMPRGGHAMLGDAAAWHRLTTAAALAMLGLGPDPDGLLRPDPAGEVPVPAGRLPR